MRKTKKPKVYTITETIYIAYQVIAMSEEDARESYQTLPIEKWDELVGEAASNNHFDDEVTNEEECDWTDTSGYPVSEKAQKYINKNLPEG